jgi:uncharacterized protein YkwD
VLEFPLSTRAFSKRSDDDTNLPFFASFYLLLPKSSVVLMEVMPYVKSITVHGLKNTYPLVFLLLASGIVSASSQANETAKESQPSVPAKITPGVQLAPPLTVMPGPLESERIVLLAKIREAKDKRVGIQNYMNEFIDLETMVSNGASQESIQERLNLLKAALDDQLSLLRLRLDSCATADADPQQKQSPLMSLEKARVYMVSLVNADRARYHLAPLVLDSIASAAGQLHSDEMAIVGYCAHWDTAGKKPWQRYTEAGGTHFDSENCAMVYGHPELTKAHLFSAKELKELESMLMDEKPPRDGHRVAILTAEHNKLGVGLSHALYTKDLSLVCLAQEFIDEYGKYSKLPSRLVRGAPFEVSGSLFKGLKLTSMEIRCESAPERMTKEQLDRTYSYNLPDTILECFPHTRTWTEAKLEHFSARITPDESWKSGLYYILIWATRPQDKVTVLVSSRTIHLD